MLKGPGINKRSSLFISLIFSYVFVLSIPLVVNIISYFHSAALIKARIEKYNMSMIEQIQQVIDEKLSSIDQLINDISLNPRVQKLTYKKGELNADDIFTMKEVVQDLLKSSNSNALARQIFLYFPFIDTVLINTGKYSPDQFYKQYMYSTDQSYDQWLQFVNQYSYKRFLPAIKMKSDGQEVVTCLQTIPLWEKEQVYGTVGVLFDVESFKSIMEKIYNVNQGVVYITNSKKELLMFSGEKKYLAEVLWDRIGNQRQGNFYETINGEKCMVLFASSQYKDWKYISVIPSSAFMYDLRSMNYTAFILELTAIILGLLLSFYVAKRNYTPIKAIANRLAGLLPNSADKAKNELILLEEATAATISQISNFKKKINKQLPVIRSNVLLQLIKGMYSERYEIKSWLDSLEIVFPHLYFQVILVSVDDASEAVRENSYEDYTLLKFAMTNFMEETCPQNYSAYMVDLEPDCMALIVNVSQPSEDTENDLRQFSAESRNFMYNAFKCNMSIGIGRAYEGLEGINKSFLDAERAIEYKIIKGNSSIIFYDEVARLDKSCYYPMDMEMHLMNSIRAGDKAKALLLLDEIFRHNFDNSGLSAEMARCLFFDIMSTVIKLLSQIDSCFSNKYNFNKNLVNELTQCKSINEMYSLIRTLIDNICVYINENKKSGNEELKNGILNYIEENYMVNNISLSLIAEAFSITPVYLSHFFKEKAGVTIMEYINRLRIDKAKDLLRNTNSDLSLIARETGYTNSAILIRTFKKYEGVTPGQFRQQI